MRIRPTRRRQVRVSNYAGGERAEEGKEEGRGLARVRRHLKHAEIERDLRAVQGDVTLRLHI